jgi:hypothetical protein
VANRGRVVGNVVNEDIKRRIDVQVTIGPVHACATAWCRSRRSCRRSTRINVIEAPIVGCYDADAGGKFRAHRDNTSSHNAHRQFALSLNLNAVEEYDGGAVRRVRPRTYCPLLAARSCSRRHCCTRSFR